MCVDLQYTLTNYLSYIIGPPSTCFHQATSTKVLELKTCPNWRWLTHTALKNGVMTEETDRCTRSSTRLPVFDGPPSWPPKWRLELNFREDQTTSRLYLDNNGQYIPWESRTIWNVALGWPENKLFVLHTVFGLLVDAARWVRDRRLVHGVKTAWSTTRVAREQRPFLGSVYLLCFTFVCSCRSFLRVLLASCCCCCLITLKLFFAHLCVFHYICFCCLMFPFVYSVLCRALDLIVFFCLIFPSFYFRPSKKSKRRWQPRPKKTQKLLYYHYYLTPGGGSKM